MTTEERPTQDNLDSQNPTNSDSQEGQSQSFEQDERFQQDPNKLYKSYRELEAFKGKTLEENKRLQEEASLAELVVSAKAAELGVSTSEARQLLKEEASKRAGSVGSGDSRALDEVRQLKNELEMRDLESREGVDKDTKEAIRKLSSETGKSPTAIYNEFYSHLSDSTKGREFVKTTGRGIPEGTEMPKDKQYNDLMVQARSTKNPAERKKIVSELMRLRNFH